MYISKHNRRAPKPSQTVDNNFSFYFGGEEKTDANEVLKWIKAENPNGWEKIEVQFYDGEKAQLTLYDIVTDEDGEEDDGKVIAKFSNSDQLFLCDYAYIGRRGVIINHCFFSFENA